MKKLLLLLFLFPFALQAQQVKTIQGRLMYNGKPLSKTAFKVQNRNIYGKTDKQGHFVVRNVLDSDYIVTTSLKDTVLRFSVAAVTDSVFSIINAPLAPPQIKNMTDTVGVKFLVPEKKNTFRSDNFSSYGYIDNIERIKKRKSAYTIDFPDKIILHKGTSFNFSTFAEINTIGQLPKLQSQYAQSESGSVIAGLPSELFSWGAPVNGTAYDATDFFCTGSSFGSMLNAQFPNIRNRGLVSAAVGQRQNNSPIPNAYSNSYNASFAVNDIQTWRIKSTLSVQYNRTDEQLMQQGSNLSSLLYSVLSTPPSFNNTDNKTLSYAPNYVQNPFLLAGELPDNRQNDFFAARAETEYSHRRIKIWAKANYDKNWLKRQDGSMNFSSNHFTDRQEETANTSAIVSTSYKILNQDSYRDVTLELIPLMYGFCRTESEVQRTDNHATQNITTRTNASLARNAHDVRYGLRFSSRFAYINLTNTHYFSNTVQQSAYTNMFPDVYVNLKTYRNGFQLQGNLKKSIGEAPLVFSNLAALSTNTQAADFRTFYENTDVFFHNGLNPEIYTKGIVNFVYYSRIFSGNISYFNNKTDNYIQPVWIDEQNFQLANLGGIQNSGYEASATLYFDYFRWGDNYYNKKKRGVFSGSITTTFSTTKSTVTSVYGDAPFVPLAGFADIATVFAKNEPVGVIYGTTYQRTEQGEICLDENGKPIVNKELTKIGDPTPDFVLTLAPIVRVKQFEFSCAMEYSHGGERWNGTRAYLDFLGMSEQSAINRTEFTENTFTQNGATGVGEDYIEDATYFRLANVTLSYTLKLKNKAFNEIKIGVTAKNLLLITDYKGVEPASNLFGYSAVRGLDLFNLPHVRSYSVSASFRF
ncbi:MAG: hypothetical protein FWC39_09890 [Bacteroidetes bacterium]|nr:hypothetical protein [Bacteroidota bacterium]